MSGFGVPGRNPGFVAQGLMRRGFGVAQAPAPPFSPLDVAGLHLWLDPTDIEALWQDAARSVQVDTDGQEVHAIDDKSGNNRHFTVPSGTSLFTYQSSLNGFAGLLGDGVNTPPHNTTKADWKFLNDGSEFYAMAVIAATDEDADESFGIVGNNGGSSSNIGLFWAHDNRSAISGNHDSKLFIGKGSFPAVIDISKSAFWGGNVVTTGEVRHEPGAAGDDNVLYGGFAKAASAESVAAHNDANPTFDIQLGAIGNGAALMADPFYQILIFSPVPSDADIASLRNYLASKFAGIPKGVPGIVEPIEVTANYDAFGNAVIVGSEIHYYARRGTSHVGDNGHIRRWKSADDGATWNQAQIANDATHDDRNVSASVVPATGTILIFSLRYDTVAEAGVDIQFRRSTDGGDTFSSPGTITPGGSITGGGPYGPMVELPSGKLMQGFSGIDGGNFVIYVQFSDDDGLTWGGTVEIENSGTLEPTEFSPVFLSGSTDATAKLLVVSRDNAGVLRQYSSSDGGATWASDGPLTISNGVNLDVSPWLYLHEGWLYLAYADRNTGRRGIRLSIADPDVVHGDVSAWHDTQLVRGNQASSGSAFGYPSIVEYNGVLHMMYYDTPTDKGDIQHTFGAAA